MKTSKIKNEIEEHLTCNSRYFQPWYLHFCTLFVRRRRRRRRRRGGWVIITAAAHNVEKIRVS